MKAFGMKAILGVWLAGLAACAATAPKNLDLAMSPSQGVVVFSVSHDADAGRAVTLMVYVDREAHVLGSAPYSSVQDVMGVRTGSDFEDDFGRLEVVNLPAGKHVFSWWQISSGRGLRVFPDKSLAPLEFEVKPGSVVYLGDFHGITSTGRNLLGMRVMAAGWPVLKDRHERDIPLFESRYPQFKGKVETRLLPAGPWVPEDMKQQLEAQAPH